MTDAVSQETAWAIQIASKHTGERVWLGAKHPTLDAARAYAEKEVCPRCYRFEVLMIPAESVWINRRDGFRRAAG